MNHSSELFYKSLDGNQKQFFNALLDYQVVCCNAKAGTGKTTICALAGLDMLDKDMITKIIYIRFPDQLTQSLGSFPGDADEKEDYYMEPIIEAFEELGISKDRLQRDYISMEKVKLCTNITLRGTNIKDALVILDESQNATFKDLKLVLTRIHDSCHVALIGHSDQCDNKHCMKEKAFEAYMHHMCQKQWARRIDLKTNYRGKISSWADELMLSDGKYYVNDK